MKLLYLVVKITLVNCVPKIKARVERVPFKEARRFTHRERKAGNYIWWIPPNESKCVVLVSSGCRPGSGKASVVINSTSLRKNLLTIGRDYLDRSFSRREYGDNVDLAIFYIPGVRSLTGRRKLTEYMDCRQWNRHLNFKLS